MRCHLVKNFIVVDRTIRAVNRLKILGCESMGRDTLIQCLTSSRWDQVKRRRTKDMKEVNEGRTWLISHGEKAMKGWRRKGK